MKIKRLNEKIENRLNLVAKEFNYSISYKGETQNVNSAVVIIPDGAKYDDGDKIDVVVYCEDENGKELNFNSVDEAQKWIDTYKDNLEFHVEHFNELHATPKNEMKEECINESKLVESTKSNATVYEVAKDGFPEVGRKFIAYNAYSKECTIFSRCNKSKWENKSDAPQHQSDDGEFYAGVNNWIYKISYDKYIYIDELNLVSETVKKSEEDANEINKKDILDCFTITFGDFLGKELANAYSVKDSKGTIKCDYPFSIRWAQPFGENAVKYPLQGIDINSALLRGNEGIEDFYNNLIKHGINDSTAKDVIRNLPNYKFSNLTNKTIKSDNVTKSIEEFLDK